MKTDLEVKKEICYQTYQWIELGGLPQMKRTSRKNVHQMQGSEGGFISFFHPSASSSINLCSINFNIIA